MFKIKKLDINTQFGKICRLCGLESSDMLDIFDPNLDLLEELHSVIPMAISLEDKLPSKICADCTRDLHIAAGLVKKILKTNETLKTSLEYKLFDKSGPVQCDICSKVFTNMELFDSHVAHHKKTTGDIATGKPSSILIVCTKCCYAFGNKSAYDFHKMTKTRFCLNCKEPLTSKCDSHVHRCKKIKIKNRINKEEKKVKVKDEFINKISVGDDTLWQCGICEKVVTTKLSLTGHLRIHSQEKPYECEFCGNKFRVRANLNQHLVTHTGTKKHACPVCNRRFARKSFVKTHMRTHTGEKPFACHICNYRFSQSGDRNRHIARHHEKNTKKPPPAKNSQQFVKIP